MNGLFIWTPKTGLDPCKLFSSCPACVQSVCREQFCSSFDPEANLSPQHTPQPDRHAHVMVIHNWKYKNTKTQKFNITNTKKCFSSKSKLPYHAHNKKNIKLICVSHRSPFYPRCIQHFIAKPHLKHLKSLDYIFHLHNHIKSYFVFTNSQRRRCTALYNNCQRGAVLQCRCSAAVLQCCSAEVQYWCKIVQILASSRIWMDSISGHL